MIVIKILLGLAAIIVLLPLLAVMAVMIRIAFSPRPGDCAGCPCPDPDYCRCCPNFPDYWNGNEYVGPTRKELVAVRRKYEKEAGK